MNFSPCVTANPCGAPPIVFTLGSAAVHAADGYARATGKVGVALVTSGPGATNAVTGLTDALMDSIPQFTELRALHPPSLQGSRDKLFKFLSGWFGGPDLFVQEYGHPRLRARHLPFSIGTQERDQWVACMVLAMEETGVPEGLRQKLLQNFFNTADFMRNRAD